MNSNKWITVSPINMIYNNIKKRLLKGALFIGSNFMADMQDNAAQIAGLLQPLHGLFIPSFAAY